MITALRVDRRTAAAAGLFTLVSLLHLGARLAGADRIGEVTQWLLMPLLAATLTCATASPRSRLVRLVLVALGFSWLGDTAPDAVDGDAAFLVMVGFFLLAQLTYIAAFLPYRERSVLGTRAVPGRRAAAGYVLAVVALVVACAPGAGVLLVPALIYGLCLGAMAVLSTGLGRIATLGGVLFLVSDAMIALGAFADWFTPPAAGFWVMLTYIAGQSLLVCGVLATDRAGREVTAVSSGER